MFSCVENWSCGWCLAVWGIVAKEETRRAEYRTLEEQHKRELYEMLQI